MNDHEMDRQSKRGVRKNFNCPHPFPTTTPELYYKRTLLQVQGLPRERELGLQGQVAARAGVQDMALAEGRVCGGVELCGT